jgi:hypothetical protein
MLPHGIKVIGRHAGDNPGLSPLVQLEELLMGPHIRAVMVDKNRQIPNHADTALVGIPAECTPLARKEELLEGKILYRYCQLLPCSA